LLLIQTAQSIGAIFLEGRQSLRKMCRHVWAGACDADVGPC
jgi:hypothetical protein